jgi:Family of unknown function (DUF6221)
MRSLVLGFRRAKLNLVLTGYSFAEGCEDTVAGAVARPSDSQICLSREHDHLASSLSRCRVIGAESGAEAEAAVVAAADGRSVVTRTEFITARLYEDEVFARAALRELMVAGSDASDEIRGYLKRINPARTLRDIEAMRQLLRVAEEAYFTGDHYAADGIERALVVIWRGHPDYDPSWATS